MDKKVRKKIDRECHFCGEDDYDLLDLHRIVPGENDGKYIKSNVLTICCKCHRKVHSGRIVVHGKHYSTLGRDVVHYTEDGEDRWK